MMEFIGGMVTGVIAFIAYGAYRAVNSPGWDDSNVLNFIRVLSFVFIHTGKFGSLYNLTDEQVEKLIDFGWSNIDQQKPFYYINKDEFSENFPGSLQ